MRGWLFTRVHELTGTLALLCLMVPEVSVKLQINPVLPEPLHPARARPLTPTAMLFFIAGISE